MSNDILVTVVGNLVSDPELRYTQGGSPVANFTIATTPRSFKDGDWQDEETIFTRCTQWNESAENMVSSLVKGMRVIATGKLEAKSWEDKEGNKRVNHELNVSDIGPSLKFAVAEVRRVVAAEEPKKVAAKPSPASAKTRASRR